MQLDRRQFLQTFAVAGTQLPAKPATRTTTRLFLDPRVVEKSTQVSMHVGKVMKDTRNPLFAEDRPWEVRYDNLYPNIHFDVAEKLYKCWYSPFTIDPSATETPRTSRQSIPYKPDRKREMGVCYATSKDGLRWSKPDLDLIEFQGSKKNNIVARGPHGAGVYFDPHESDPSRRYKMLLQGKSTSGAFSPDGLRWTEPVPFPSIGAIGDTHNNAIYSQNLGRYVAITRLWDRPAKQRLVGRTESIDFKTWTPAVEVMRAEASHPENQTYAMPIFEHGNLFFGLLMIFHAPSDTVHCELAWSVDSIQWTRLEPGTPFIPKGAAGESDSGCVYAGTGPVFLDNEVRIYYGASNGPHTGWRDGFLNLARARTDGFAFAAPSGGQGTILTKPVKLSGDLLCNIDAAGGQARIGIPGADGFSLDDAIPLRSDSTRHTCRWKKQKTEALHGRDVQLVVELQSARAYSFLT
ncbi:MAG: hypothetical protein SGI92_23825 [Bryobacteraceae bacterium]|nr:hypothetical protein [Bryobacteraceae bacterium]